MGRAPCCDKTKVKRGPWSPDEDALLKDYIHAHGTVSNWIALPRKSGLNRCGKSCRLRWLNYLRPDIVHGGFTDQEDSIICSLYFAIGSRWSVIASKLQGRTDNDIKNYWNTKLKKKIMAGKVRGFEGMSTGLVEPDSTRFVQVKQEQEIINYGGNYYDNGASLMPYDYSTPVQRVSEISSSIDDQIENSSWGEVQIQDFWLSCLFDQSTSLMPGSISHELLDAPVFPNHF